MAREVVLTPVQQPPVAGREVVLTPVTQVDPPAELTADIQPGITRGVAAEAGDPSGFREGVAETVAAGGRSLLPAIGLVGGGLVGAPSGPAGSVGGAGLGFAAGERAADTLARLLGQPGGPETFAGQAEQTLSDIIEGGLIETGGQAAGKAISALAAVPGRIAQRKIGNVASRQAADLGISPKALDVVRRNSPEFQAATAGRATEVSVASRAREAVAGARKNIGDRFRGELDKLGRFDEVDLRVPKSRIEFNLEKFGIKRNKKGKVVLGERRGGLNPTEQTKLKELVDKVDDKLADSNRVTLDEAESFRQELRDAVNRLVQNQDVTRAGEDAFRSVVRSYEEGINSLKPGFQGLAKKFRSDYAALEKAQREMGLTSERALDSTIARKLRSIIKSGDEIQLQAIRGVEELSGLNVSDLAVGNQIAKNLAKGKPTIDIFSSRPQEGISSTFFRSLGEFGRSPGERALLSPETIGRGGRTISAISKLAEPSTGAGIDANTARLLRTLSALTQENQ
jgi:hypothetical protein